MLLRAALKLYLGVPIASASANGLHWLQNT